MRPERKAPDNIADLRSKEEDIEASMRPERKAPDNLDTGDLARFHNGGFNEAGAKSPG